MNESEARQYTIGKQRYKGLSTVYYQAFDWFEVKLDEQKRALGDLGFAHDFVTEEYWSGSGCMHQQHTCGSRVTARAAYCSEQILRCGRGSQPEPAR